MADPLLDLEMRRRIVAHIQGYPGLHAREIARQLGIDQSLLEYHLERLAAGGHVLLEFDSRFKRAYPRPAGAAVPATPSERRMLGALRDDIHLSIVLHLLNAGPLAHKDLAERVGLSKSLLSYHLDKLQARSLVRKGADGRFAVQSPDRVEAMLLRHQPTEDFLSRFVSLWDAFYEST
jgi:predicted transcriptional regulator